MNLKKERNHKAKRFAHIAAGLVILIHAYEKFESGHNSYIYFCIAGIIFLLIAFLHTIIERKAPWIDAVFFIIEGLLSVIIALDYFHLGKQGLPWVYIAVAIFQLFMAIKFGKKGLNKHNAENII